MAKQNSRTAETNSSRNVTKKAVCVCVCVSIPEIFYLVGPFFYFMYLFIFWQNF